jgi:hypothetical protein
MDSYREHSSDFDPSSSADDAVNSDGSVAIGTDERRMHVRAYNYWVSLLDGRDFPSIEDLEPADVSDFAGNSVLLDFTCGRDNPAIPYIGAAIREECGLDLDTRTIADVPSRSLLSRLTDHYLQIIANRAPIGFEAEFGNQREDAICYRGILMPFSSDGETIDFIYGVINWKQVAFNAAGNEEQLHPELPHVPFDISSNDANAGPNAGEPLELTEVVAGEQEATTAEVAKEMEPAPGHQDSQAVHFSWEDGPLADVDAGELPKIDLQPDPALADRLWAARETAEAVRAGEGRTRVALYGALSLAFDFALAALESPDEYAQLLEDSGVKAQARAPMTPVVKLVFGIDYDKARLTEFAAALSYALRQEIGLGRFQEFIEKRAGGLKALVAAEREARRPEPRSDTKGEVARARLRSAPPISLADVPAQEEFALVVTRRGANGLHEAVAMVEDPALIERAIRTAA